jgi:hypothetical protein
MNSFSRKIQAAVLSLAMLVPAGAAMAKTRKHHHKHYSQTGGAIVGAAAGALIDHHHPLTGAALGGALGLGVQYERNKKVNH